MDKSKESIDLIIERLEIIELGSDIEIDFFDFDEIPKLPDFPEVNEEDEDFGFEWE